MAESPIKASCGWVNYDVIPVFGSSLYQLLREQRIPAPSGCCIPTWLASLCDYLTQELASEGASLCTLIDKQGIDGTLISSVATLASADLEKLSSVYARLCGGNQVSWPDIGVLLAARFLRLVLERLPEPLLTLDFHDLFVGVAQDFWEDNATQLSTLLVLVAVLPVPHAQLLRRLVAIFSFVSPNERRTLAEVWGPILLLREGTHPYEATRDDAARLVSLLARHADTLKDGHDTPAVPVVSFLYRTPLTSSVVTSSHPAPHWLSDRNARRITAVVRALEKLRSLSHYLRGLDSEHGLGLAEFLHLFPLLELRLSAIASLPQPSTATRLLDTFHLSRAYRYLCDLDETLHCTQDLGSQDGRGGDSRLLLYFTNERLRESLERLRLAMHYEATLFCDQCVDLFGVSAPATACAALAVGLIDHPSASSFWTEEFGADRYSVGFRYVCDAWAARNGAPLTSEATQRLRSVLDPCRADFVTVYRFAELMKGFRQGDLITSLSSVIRTLTQPWFHANVPRGAIANLMEPQPVGTFLVRFSASSPGAFAFDYKKADGLFATKIFTEENHYMVVESVEVTRAFESLEAVVAHYERVGLLVHPLLTRLMEAPYFFGFLTMDETDWCLQGEKPGTFLVRFSLTFRDQLTVSFMGQEGALNSLRLERLQSGRVSFMEQTFASVDAALAAYAALFPRPYREVVSLQLEEDELWRRSCGDRDRTAPARFFQPAHAHVSPSAPPSLDLLLKKKLEPESARAVLAESLDDPEKWTARTSQACSLVERELCVKIATVEPSSLVKTQTPLNTRVLLAFTLSNVSSSRTVQYEVEEPLLLNRRCFFSVRKATGQLNAREKEGSSVDIEVAVVLYRPIVLRRLITVRLSYTDGPELWVHVPLRVACDRGALPVGDGATSDGAEYWVVRDDELSIGESISGTVGNVNAASLYGAKVAIKRWDYGSKQPVPESFTHELNILRELQHECLVSFVGACTTKPGFCYIVTEYCVNNSLFSYLPQQTLSLENRTQLALDAAVGMNHLHAHHLVHRDLKSLNLLVDSRGRVKVADFGETRVVSHLMTPERGSYNWMAPEVLKTRTYTGKADVFSYGIILWEICTAQRPDRLMSDILAGVTFIFPKVWMKQLPELVELAKLCWQLNPAKRPSFAVLCQRLQLCRERLAAAKDASGRPSRKTGSSRRSKHK